MNNVCFYESVLSKGPDSGHHNWVIFAGEEPVGLITAQIQDRPNGMLHKSPDGMFHEAPEDLADYPMLGTGTYIAPECRCNGYAAAAKRLIREHDATKDVRSLSCTIADDNPESLQSIRNAGYECVGVEEVEGGPNKLHFGLRL